jgi:outer membrane protein TolC
MRRLALILLSAALAATAAAQELSPTLTLDDAIHLALLRNKNLKASSYYRGISRANLLVARGAFDPSLFGNRSSSNTPENLELGSVLIDNIRTDSYSFGVQGLLPLGTQYTVSGSTQDEREQLSGYSRNYMTFGGFTLTQPLLRNFGFDANLVNVRVAKANRAISDLTYRASAINTVTNVVIAYSNLQLAHDQLNAAQRSRDNAATLLQGNEKEYKVGNISQSDVITARSNLAAQEEPILLAQRAVRDDQNQLRDLIGEDVFFEDEPLFTLAPVTIPDVTVNPKADIARALSERPDYLISRLGITKDRALEKAAINGVLPEVDFVGGYGYNGLATTFDVSRQQVEDKQNPSYSAGLAVTIPLTFAVGRGKLRAARLQRLQDEEFLRQSEADIAVGVAAAAGQIVTTKQRVAADEAAYDLAKQALDAEVKKKVAGTSTTLAVVQQQNFVTAAEINVSFAVAAERQAVANYDQALGTTLERYHIVLTDE